SRESPRAPTSASCCGTWRSAACCRCPPPNPRRRPRANPARAPHHGHDEGAAQMSEADLATPVPVRKPGPRRRWLVVAGLVALPLLLWAVISSYVGPLADVDLQAALAEADRLDPGWRLDDLLHRRTKSTDGDNPALQVLRAKALLPYGWGAKKEFN